jgi:hypothetical protein
MKRDGEGGVSEEVELALLDVRSSEAYQGSGYASSRNQARSLRSCS